MASRKSSLPRGAQSAILSDSNLGKLQDKSESSRDNSRDISSDSETQADNAYLDQNRALTRISTLTKMEQDIDSLSFASKPVSGNQIQGKEMQSIANDVIAEEEEDF